MRLDAQNATMVSEGDKVVYDGKVATLVGFHFPHPDTHEVPTASLLYDDGTMDVVPNHLVRALTKEEKAKLRHEADKRTALMILGLTVLGAAIGTALAWLIALGVLR